MPDLSDKDEEQFELSTQPTVTEAEEANQSGPLSDTDRLRMLGYDSVLGRPLGFWGSAGMTICYNPVVYEFSAFATVYAYRAPLLFIIGHPFLVILHLLLLGPFAELVSTFPVAGGMATWAWQAARHGIRGERQWAWVVAGLTLAGHFAKTVSNLWLVTRMVCELYYSLDPRVGDWNLRPAYVEPVAQLGLVAAVACACFFRWGNNNLFWALGGLFTIASGFLWFGMLLSMNNTLKTVPDLGAMVRPLDWGFPTRSEWIYSMARMIFMGLPLRVTAIDCPVHMAEETRRPSRTVPRVMFYTSLVHHMFTYVLVVMHIVIIVPFTQEQFLENPFISSAILAPSSTAVSALTSIAMIFPNVLQILAWTVVSSRFIFALARDRGLPFANFLVRTTKHRSPWGAMLAIIVALAVTSVGYFIPEASYYPLIVAVGFYSANLTYILPLVLYLLSHLNLRLVGRPEFSLGRFSRPLSVISVIWLTVSTIQGLLPLTQFNGGRAPDYVTKDVPWFFIYNAFTLLCCLITWFLYGKRHFIGPIRALTIWTTGTDIDPRNVAANPRGGAIRDFIARETGRTGSAEPTTPRATFSNPRSPVSPGSPKSALRSSKLQRFLGRSSDSRSRSKPTSPLSSQGAGSSPQHLAVHPSILPESGVLPPHSRVDSVLPESGVLPESQVPDHTRTAISVIPESGVLPESQHDYRDGGVSVIPESGVFPDSHHDYRNTGVSPIPESSARSEHTETMSEEVPLRSPTSVPHNDPYPLSFTTSFTGSNDMHSQSAAQIESQLFPEATPSRRMSRPPPPPPRRFGSRG